MICGNCVHHVQEALALGAGAVLAGIVRTVRGITLFSEYKAAMFITAAAMLALSGILQWRSRNDPSAQARSRR